MKLIPLSNKNIFKPREIIEIVVSRPATGQVILPDEMRKRCRILNELEKTEGEQFLLEDADHELLTRLIRAFGFGVAHPELLQIIDDVVDAKAPEAEKQVGNTC